jgi:hypothetical protein
MIALGECRAQEIRGSKKAFPWSRLAGTTSRDLYQATVIAKPL